MATSQSLEFTDPQPGAQQTGVRTRYIRTGAIHRSRFVAFLALGCSQGLLAQYTIQHQQPQQTQPQQGQDWRGREAQQQHDQGAAQGEQAQQQRENDRVREANEREMLAMIARDKHNSGQAADMDKEFQRLGSALNQIEGMISNQGDRLIIELAKTPINAPIAKTHFAHLLELSKAYMGLHPTLKIQRGVDTRIKVMEAAKRAATSYYGFTQQYIELSSGLRPPERQANAMYDRFLLRPNAGGYANVAVAQDIYDTFVANAEQPRDVAVRAMAARIEHWAAQGQMLSNHAGGLAFDISTKDLTREQVQALIMSVMPEGGEVELETDPEHLHVEFDFPPST